MKTIRVVLKPIIRQKYLLLSMAKAIPEELRPKYEKGVYPQGCARIVSNAIQKIWQTCRSTKQIPIDKQISKIIKKNRVLCLKLQKELIPTTRVNPELEELLLNHYNSAVVWLKGNKWVADVLVNIQSHYDEHKPEAVIGIDLGKWHNAYSIWINGKEVYRAFDKFGKYHFVMQKLTHRIALVQQKFEGTRKQLAKKLNPLYEKKRMVLWQYFGTLRNKILEHIPEGYNAVFVLEDLDSLPRAELRKTQRTWAHQELANGIFASQIEWNGYKVVKVNARGTTHTCWKCGNPVKSRIDRTIVCESCYPKGLDRDLNGARNIARRYMLSCIPERSCTGNDRLSPLAMCELRDNREKLEKVSESNGPPTLVAEWL